MSFETLAVRGGSGRGRRALLAPGRRPWHRPRWYARAGDAVHPLHRRVGQDVPAQPARASRRARPSTIASDGAPIDTATADAAGSFQRRVQRAADPPAARANVLDHRRRRPGPPAGPLALPEVKLSVERPSDARRASACCSAPTASSPARPSTCHIRRGGKTRGRFRLGKADSPCGLTKRRLRAMPLSHYSTGTYEFWFGSDEELRPQQARSATACRSSGARAPRPRPSRRSRRAGPRWPRRALGTDGPSRRRY